VRGASWIVVWVIVLRCLHLPWEHLGGIVSERQRWLERFVLGAGLLVGSFVGGFVRDKAITGLRSHADALRLFWMPPAGLVAAAMIAVTDWRWKLMLVVAVASYSAGLDLAVGAWPLLDGRDYRFLGRIREDADPGVEEP
jgi:hypothetical protein